MPLKRFIQKNFGLILTSVGTGIGVDAYRLTLEERKARLEAASNDNSRLTKELRARDEYIINSQETQNKVSGLSAEAKDHGDSVNHENGIIREIVKKLENKNISESERTLLHKELLHHTENQAKSAEASNKNLEQILDLTKDKPKESSTNILNDFIETYKEFLSTLSLEQIGAATQLTALAFLFLSWITVVSILYGEFLIKYLNLEKRFP